MKHLPLSLLIVLILLSGSACQKAVTEPPENFTNVRVFFTTLADNENMLDCSKTGSVERKVANTGNKYENALKQLFLGPTEEEKALGIQTFWLNAETGQALQEVRVEGNTAYVDWTDLRETIPNASASCGSASFLSPIENTLKQFPEITRVVHSINGSPETFYEWMQMEYELE
jgi:hypothetical protein